MTGNISKGKLACLAAAIAIGAALIGAPAQARGGGSGWHGRFFPHHRFAFFHRRHFGPFFGVYASAYSSCWNWVPTAFGWRQVWVCGPYGYGYD